MRPQVISKIGTGTTSWIPVDYRVAAFSLSLGVVISGTVSYTVEYTLDNVLEAGTTATAFPVAGLTAQTVSAAGTITAPVMAVRLNIGTGSGSATLTILQGSRT